MKRTRPSYKSSLILLTPLINTMSGDAFVVVILKPEIATGFFKFTSDDTADQVINSSPPAPPSSISGVSAVEAAFLLPNGRIISTILSLIKDKGFEIVQRLMTQFTKSDIRDLFSFELQQRLQNDDAAFSAFLTSFTIGPSLALLLKVPASVAMGDVNAAITNWNEVVGDWDPVIARKKALAASIPHDQWPLRALCGLNAIQNGVINSSHECCARRERFVLFPPRTPRLERATIVLLPSFYVTFPASRKLLLSAIEKVQAVIVEEQQGCSLSGEEVVALCGLSRTFNEDFDQVCVDVVELMEQTIGGNGVDVLTLEGLNLNNTLRFVVGPANLDLARRYFPESIRGQMSSKLPSVELPEGLHLKETADDVLGFESGLFLSFDSKLHLGNVNYKALAGVPVEFTLALMKPNAACNSDVVAEIMHQINLFGFTVERQRRLLLSRAQAADFYAEHRGKPFFETLLGFMTSGEIVALQLSRSHAVKAWRGLMGPTNSTKARETHPWTLRARFGADGTRNATHGSDSSTSAAREVNFFFGSAVSASRAMKEPNGAVRALIAAQTVLGVSDNTVEQVLTQGLKKLLENKISDPLEACRWLGEWLIDYQSRGLEEEDQVIQRAQIPEQVRVSEKAKADFSVRKVIAISLDVALNGFRNGIFDALCERLESDRYLLVDVATELDKFTVLDLGVAHLVKMLTESGRRRCVLFGCENLTQDSIFYDKFKTYAPLDWQINFVVHLELQKNNDSLTAISSRQSLSINVPVLNVTLSVTLTSNPEMMTKSGDLQGLFHEVFDPNIVLIVDTERLVCGNVWTEIGKHFGFSVLTFDTFLKSVKILNDSGESQLLLNLVRSGSKLPSTLILSVLRRVILGTQPGINSNSISQKFMLLEFPWLEIQASEWEHVIGQPQCVLYVSERAKPNNLKRENLKWMNNFQKKGLVKHLWIDSSSVDCNTVRSQVCNVFSPFIGCFLGQCETEDQLQLLQSVAKSQGFIWMDFSPPNIPTTQQLQDLLLGRVTGRSKFLLYGYPQTVNQCKELCNLATPQFVIHNSSALVVAHELLTVFDEHSTVLQLDLATANGSDLRSIFFGKQVVALVGSVEKLLLPQFHNVLSPLGFDVLNLRKYDETNNEFSKVRELERRIQAVQAPRCLVVGGSQSPSFYHALEARIGCGLHKILILQQVPVRFRATNTTDDDSDSFSDEEENEIQNGSNGDDNAMATKSTIKWRKVLQALSPQLAQLLQTFAASSTSSISIEALGFLESTAIGSSRVIQDIVSRLRPQFIGVIGHPFSFYQTVTRNFCRQKLVGFIDLRSISNSSQALEILETLVATTPYSNYCLDGFPRSDTSSISTTTRYVAQQVWELNRRLGAFTRLVQFTSTLEMLEMRTSEQITRRMLDEAQDDLESTSTELLNWFTTGKNHRTIFKVTCDGTLEEAQRDLNNMLKNKHGPNKKASKVNYQ